MHIETEKVNEQEILLCMLKCVTNKKVHLFVLSDSPTVGDQVNVGTYIPEAAKAYGNYRRLRQIKSAINFWLWRYFDYKRFVGVCCIMAKFHYVLVVLSLVLSEGSVVHKRRYYCYVFLNDTDGHLCCACMYFGY